MNMTCESAPDVQGDFVEWVAFKWLMAGVGWRVDLTRLQRDNAYVSECLQCALSTDSESLQGHCRRLLARSSLIA